MRHTPSLDRHFWNGLAHAVGFTIIVLLLMAAVCLGSLI